MPALKEESVSDWITDAGSAFHIHTVAGEKRVFLDVCTGILHLIHLVQKIINLCIIICKQINSHIWECAEYLIPF